MAEEVATTHTVALGLLKASLGYFDSALEPSMEKYLMSLVNISARRLERDHKILLTAGDYDDEDLIAMYADWRYRKRITGAPMSDMLRAAIRNRQTRDALNAAAAGVRQ